MTITQMVQLFLDAHSDLKKITIRNYKIRLDYFTSFSHDRECRLLMHLDSTIILRFEQWVRTRATFGQNTRYCVLHTFKKFLSFLFQNHFVMIDYSELVHLPKWQKSKKKAYSDTDIRRILTRFTTHSAHDSRDKALVALHLLHKLSSSQLAGLKVIDVNIPEKKLRIVSTRKFISLSTQSSTCITTYLKCRARMNPKSDSLFIVDSGVRALKHQRIRTIIKEALK